jgi:GNAT superfamily N-acetyltransferase
VNIHLGYRPGCIGRITEMHAAYYASAVGFGARFEAKVATELSAFLTGYVEGRDGLWLALASDRIEGAIAIDGSNYRQCGAHLRWFITSDAVRGKGIGTLLLDAALAFCQSRAYSQVYLWTFDELHAARHLYEKHGFKLSRSQRGAQWGKEVNEQLFTLGTALTPAP